ncbi:MAG: NADH-quinone oxidoreductase subunit C [Lacibacter sp.]
MSTDTATPLPLEQLLPALTPVAGGPWPTYEVAPENWLATAAELRNHPQLQFDFLFCLTCIDWKTHLTMVYHMRSTRLGHHAVIKSNLNREQPIIESVSHIWRTAEFHEREVYEMFGVQFANHPNLQLLILPAGWEGKNPLRKDFEDPVNMIRL